MSPSTTGAATCASNDNDNDVSAFGFRVASGPEPVADTERSPVTASGSNRPSTPTRSVSIAVHAPSSVRVRIGAALVSNVSVPAGSAHNVSVAVRSLVTSTRLPEVLAFTSAAASSPG